MGKKGQVGLPQVLSMLILVFVIFVVGKALFNTTVLDPDSTDGGITATGALANAQLANQNPLANIGFVVMTAIIIIAAMASIVIRFF